MGKTMAWIASHPALAGGLCLLAAFLALNVLAYRHAWTMTHFLPAGGWKRKPEVLRGLDKVRALVSGIHLCRPMLDARPETFGLPSETHTFAGTRADLEAWFVPHPAPSGIVLLFHGYNACKAKLLPEARCFYDLGYSCFLVDFPGCGGSAGDTTTIGFLEADDVARAADHVRRTWPGLPVFLFGQSMGAAAVLRALALHRIEPEAVILESPFDRLLTTVKARFATMGVPSFPAAHLMVFWGGLQRGYNAFRHNPVDYACRVRCPVLLLHGRDDRRVRCREAEAVFAALAGDKEMQYFGGLGHESFAAQRPDEWKGYVAAFLHNHTLAHGRPA
jgi:alpha-beta hydrolase superfamily lysophospholipase